MSPEADEQGSGPVAQPNKLLYGIAVVITLLFGWVLRLQILYGIAGTEFFWPLLAVFLVTNIAHAVCTLVHQHEGVPTAIAALFGVKCLVDGYKITFGGPNAYAGSPFDAEKNFAISRMIEAVGGCFMIFAVADLFERESVYLFPIMIGLVQSAAFLALFGYRYKKGRWCC